VGPLVDTSSCIYLAGHTGLVGGAIHRALAEAGFTDVVGRDVADVDMTDQAATHASMKAERPDAVIVAAAKVGGIMANWEQPWEFVYQNLLIEANLIGAAFACGVRRLIFLGSSCIYPTSHVLPALIRKFHEAKIGLPESGGETGAAAASSCPRATSPTRPT